MKLKILLFLCFVPYIFLKAQIVSTFAGIPDSTGTNDGAAQQATFNNPHGMAVGPDGTLYVTDRFNHTIRKITLEGEVSTIAGEPGVSGDSDGQGAEAHFYEPWGITVDAQNTIFVTDTRNNKIKKITQEGLVTTYAGTGAYGISNGPGNVATFGFPSGIEADAEGNLFVADHNTHIIRKINTAGFVTTIAGIPYILGNIDGPTGTATFNRPYGLTLDQEGNIYVADEWNHKIRKVSLDGTVSTLAGTGYEGSTNGPGTEAAFSFPWDVTVDADGIVYVADGYNYAIRKISPTGENMVSTYAGNLGVSGAIDGFGEDAAFISTTGIAYSTFTREIFVSDAYNDIIRRITDINLPVEIRMEEGAIIDCPGESVAISAYPQVYDLYEFYINDELIELSPEPYFDSLDLSSGIHTLKVIPYYNFMAAEAGTLNVERHWVAPAEITAQSSLVFFEGDSVLLRASEGFEFFWSTGGDTREITVFSSQSVTVEITDANDCMDISDPVEIQAVPIPEPIRIELNGPSTFCLSQNIALQTNYGGQLQWYRDNVMIEGAREPVYYPMQSGFFQVEHTMDNGLTIKSDSLQITISESPIIDFTSEKNAVWPGESITLESSSQNVTHIEWLVTNSVYQASFAGESPTVSITESGKFDILMIGINEDTGCRDTLISEDYLTIFSEAEVEDDVFVPNIFTPNGDDKNDVLYARGRDLVEMEFLVFNKEGQMVFQSMAKEIGWDGSINGGDPVSANYIYQLSYTNRFGTRKRQRGKVVLYK